MTNATPSASLHTSHISSLTLLARGKVRDNYAVGSDRILMVASDRLSAFDVIMGEGIPGKGALLTKMALFWFDKLGQIKTKDGANLCPNHLTGESPESAVTAAEVPLVTGRSMLVKRLTPIPVEAVVRGYLAGSGWAEYQKSQSVCGVPLPAGLQNASKLPEPIFTPAAKAAVGEQGIIIADTKFEFGLDENGTLTLMDEVLTPDSSRFWPAESYEASFKAGQNPPSFDKQFVRDWLESQPWDKTPPAPRIPQDIIAKTAAKYQEAWDRLTG